MTPCYCSAAAAPERRRRRGRRLTAEDGDWFGLHREEWKEEEENAGEGF